MLIRETNGRTALARVSTRPGTGARRQPLSRIVDSSLSPRGSVAATSDTLFSFSAGVPNIAVKLSKIARSAALSSGRARIR